jgi:hypothetical protein
MRGVVLKKLLEHVFTSILLILANQLVLERLLELLFSIASPDQELRMLGYECLGAFKKSLEVHAIS